ncbi:hypothetical protein CYY_005544 [Polysphondylium violaceum]|uniref:Coiled-coil domain-containing protein 58 n=1 Tax=Polysphondylium violaceum TaxID=133409 RepID=A0A8J4UYM4_9MYCE|nr:hypothetical protein CYY_005544 [Polysphondylium violaceum]
MESADHNNSSSSSNTSNNISSLRVPKTCNYVELKDFLVSARKENTNIEMNKIRDIDSECRKVWQDIETRSILRKQVITNCIQETELSLQKAKESNNDSLIRSEKQKLNFLNMEKNVEDILVDYNLKIFQKMCG